LLFNKQKNPNLYERSQGNTVLLYMQKLKDADTAEKVRVEISQSVWHISQRTRPDVKARRSNQRRSIEYVHGVVTGMSRLHTAKGRSVRRQTDVAATRFF
jgi:hypothetical protein